MLSLQHIMYKYNIQYHKYNIIKTLSSLRSHLTMPTSALQFLSSHHTHFNNKVRNIIKDQGHVFVLVQQNKSLQSPSCHI